MYNFQEIIKLRDEIQSRLLAGVACVSWCECSLGDTETEWKFAIHIFSDDGSEAGAVNPDIATMKKMGISEYAKVIVDELVQHKCFFSPQLLDPKNQN